MDGKLDNPFRSNALKYRIFILAQFVYFIDHFMPFRTKFHLFIILFCIFFLGSVIADGNRCYLEKDALNIIAAPGQNVAVDVGFLVDCYPSITTEFNFSYSCDFTTENPGWIQGRLDPFECSLTPTRRNVTCNYLSDENTHEILVALDQPGTGWFESPIRCNNPKYSNQPFLFLNFHAPAIPQILGLLSFPSNDTVRITWNTDLTYTTSNFFFGTQQSLMNLPATNELERNQVGTNIEFNLAGLNPSTQYFFNATSCNDQGIPIVCNSTFGNFTTTATPAQSTPIPTPNNSSTPSYLLILEVDYPNEAIPKGSPILLDIAVWNQYDFNAKFELKITRILNGVEMPLPIANGPYITQGSMPIRFFDFQLPSSDWVEGAYTLKVEANIIAGVDKSLDQHKKEFPIIITREIPRPQISKLIVSSLTTTTATISWETNIPANSKISYGIGSALSKMANNPILQTNHALKITGLFPGTVYGFVVTSCSSANACNTSEKQSFKTFDDAYAACQGQNYCNAKNSFVKFMEQNGTCMEQMPIPCIASGCFKPSCDALKGGCVGVEDLAKCPEVCGGNLLKLNPQCMQSDSNSLNGECIYHEIPCNEFNNCLKDYQSCGGKQYYCVKDGAKYEWRTDNSACALQGLGDKASYQITAAEPSRNPESINLAFNLNSDEYDQTIIKAKAGKRNLISATAIDIEPFLWDKEKETVHVYVVTSSQSDLNIVECASSKDSISKCFCETGYKGKNTNFKCDVLPPSIGNYTITLLNSESEGGKMQIELIPGKKASVFKVIVPDTENQLLFYFALGLGALLIIIVLLLFANKKYKERRFGRNVSASIAMIPAQQEQLKARYMKGQISAEELQRANGALEKRKAELEASLQEWEKRHPSKRQNDAAIKATEMRGNFEDNKPDEIPEKFKKKTTDKKPSEKKSGLDEENKDLASLLDALKLKDDKKGN
jgi:hypothetical protein